MQGYFKIVSNKDLAEISRMSPNMKVNDIINGNKNANPVSKAFSIYLQGREDIKDKSALYQVSCFNSDMNSEIIFRFQSIY
jgi:hypothetical protein